MRNNRITWREIFSTTWAKEAQGLSLWPSQRGEIKCFAVLGIMEGRECGGGLSATDELALAGEQWSRRELVMENKKQGDTADGWSLRCLVWGPPQVRSESSVLTSQNSPGWVCKIVGSPRVKRGGRRAAGAWPGYGGWAWCCSGLVAVYLSFPCSRSTLNETNWAHICCVLGTSVWVVIVSCLTCGGLEDCDILAGGLGP